MSLRGTLRGAPGSDGDNESRPAYLGHREFDRQLLIRQLRSKASSGPVLRLRVVALFQIECGRAGRSAA
jgi:hypothetical protein